jgi:predicted TPR repeat methyltransferase
MLDCRSPQVTAEALARALKRLALDPMEVRLLDLGAGTGLVGELVRGFGIAGIVGLDALEAARQACLRERPAVYRDYLTGDLAELRLELLSRLRATRPAVSSPPALLVARTCRRPRS